MPVCCVGGGGRESLVWVWRRTGPLLGVSSCCEGGVEEALVPLQEEEERRALEACAAGQLVLQQVALA